MASKIYHLFFRIKELQDNKLELCLKNKNQRINFKFMDNRLQLLENGINFLRKKSIKEIFINFLRLNVK
jgi:hypothetical protein